MFGYAFCEVTALAAVTMSPQCPASGSTSTYVNSGQTITFFTQATAQPDTTIINNEFCSLTLQLTVSLNGESKSITFAIRKSTKALIPTVTTWNLNGVSQTITFSLDPTTLQVTAVLESGTILATTNGVLVIGWQAIDSRDTLAIAVSAPSQVTVGYACDLIGL